ncbi:MAG: flagellar hook-associated protein FlgL [Firmicutes bacterium]|nr:flagellar hook-associated protein FlgL [Bacillota bacterium]
MRITNKTLTNNMLRDLNSVLSRLDKYQRQLCTEQRVSLPSDDPASVANIMSLRTSLVETEQYLSNVEDAYSWLDSTDTVFSSVTSILHRSKELTIYSATETLSDSDRQAIEAELEQLFDNVLQLANSTHGGKYLFAGQKNTTIPYQRQSDDPGDPGYFKIVYNGGFITDEGRDLASMNIQINPNAVLSVNVSDAHENISGVVEDKLFTPIFTALEKIITNTKNNDTQALSNENLGELDEVLDNILSYRSVVGAKMNRIDLSKERLQDLKVNLSKLLSKDQGIDVAEVIMHLKSEENVYRRALAVGARILQPSLMDFLG